MESGTIFSLIIGINLFWLRQLFGHKLFRRALINQKPEPFLPLLCRVFLR
jgi:hypothetical protein